MGHRIVLLRHGESIWNKENRFTGWTDVDLSEQGRAEAREAGRLLKSEGFRFDMAHVSVLKRAIRTVWIALDEMETMWLPVRHAWQLNERHYGALQGLNKAETAAKFGEEQVLVWRRSYDVPPPPLPAGDARDPARDPRYAGLAPSQVPQTECLKDTVARVVPYWNNVLVPQIAAGKSLLITAHGNTIRALVKHLDHVTAAEIVKLNVPTAVPLVYELDAQMAPIRQYYLGDADAVAAKIAAVATQGKAKP